MNESEKKLKEINQGPGSSIWLSSLLLTEEGYVLNKQGFTDMIKVRYGYHLHRLSETCVLVYVFVCLRACVRACVCVCVCEDKSLTYTLYHVKKEDLSPYDISKRHYNKLVKNHMYRCKNRNTTASTLRWKFIWENR